MMPRKRGISLRKKDLPKRVRMALPPELSIDERIRQFAVQLDTERAFAPYNDELRSDFARDPLGTVHQLYRNHGTEIPPAVLKPIMESGGGDPRHIGFASAIFNIVDKPDQLFLFTTYLTVKYKGINDGDQITIVDPGGTAKVIHEQLPWKKDYEYANSEMSVDIMFNKSGYADTLILTFTPRLGVVLPHPGPASPDAFPLRRLDIDRLPYELLIRTLSRLSPEELEGLCGSSIRWQGLCGSDAFWQDLIAEQGWTDQAMRLSGSWKNRYAFLHAGVDAEALKTVLVNIWNKALLFTPLPTQTLLRFHISNGHELSQLDIHHDVPLLIGFINNTAIHVDSDPNKVIGIVRRLLVALNRLVRASYELITINIGWNRGVPEAQFVFKFQEPTRKDLVAYINRPVGGLHVARGGPALLSPTIPPAEAPPAGALSPRMLPALPAPPQGGGIHLGSLIPTHLRKP